ncbi:MAG TPA: selenocysteine-specific translation elongation factor [Dehalococcoidia bacterium]|nr:selenocysteine-specific translation elongation factor [Dehalococcoidia bacterium]
MFVLGTAGHIDHGKSVLVHALTGIDPDRLSEEKERGMTIDLGFAWMKLPSGREVGIVDVPGHERFVRNMLAGVGGIDLALLVIAANEGVMPQTREHLAILDLLEIRQGVVAVTKKDLVDEELLSLVRMEIDELLAPTTLAGAPVVAVSALTGEGLPELISTIDGLLESTAQRRDMERARLPIDRVFTMAGSGTVVTGTLIDGLLSVGQEVEIVPAGIKSRLRGLQMHKSRIEVAQPGSRIAANLVGVATTQLHRGDVVVRPGWLKPTSIISAHFRLLSYQRRPLRHNAELSFYSGAAEAIARVRLLESEELKPGEAAWVQLLLDRPVAVVNGDHFIIRSSMDTLGGGRIADAHAKRLRRFRSSVIQALEVRERGSAEEVLLSLLEARQPLSLSALASASDLPVAGVEAALTDLIEQGRVISTGRSESRLLFTESGWQKTVDKATDLVREYHKRFPARAGMPGVELGNKLGTRVQVPAILSGLVEQGIVIEEGPNIRLPEHRVQFTPAQQAQVDAFLKSLRDNPYAPPADLIPEADVLGQLIARQEVVKVAEGVVFSAKAYNEMVDRVTTHIKSQGKVTLAEVRDILQTSRKYAQALLEYLDSKKVTRRVGDERVLY